MTRFSDKATKGPKISLSDLSEANKEQKSRSRGSAVHRNGCQERGGTGPRSCTEMKGTLVLGPQALGTGTVLTGQEVAKGWEGDTVAFTNSPEGGGPEAQSR